MADDPLTGWGLRPVQLADRALLDSYFATLAHPLSDYTFSQLFTWSNSLKILWKQIAGHLCVFANGAGDLTLLVPPIGDTGAERALAECFELMDEYNASRGVPHRTRVEYVSDELAARIDRSRVQLEPMGFDYVYETGKMIDLPGGDLASKRQAKNRFTRLYEHRVEPYSAAAHLDACRRLLAQWKTHQDTHDETGNSTSEAKRLKEAKATDLCLEVAEEIGLKGMVVSVKGEEGWAVRGFTFGEPLGHDQSSITVEKTDLTCKGLAQFIFSEFCRTCWADRPLVNAGDDWGLETLAWTKMSYRPVKLLQKYVMRKQPAVTAAVPAAVEPKADALPIPSALPAMEGAEPLPVRVRLADRKDVAAALELEHACFSADVRLKKRQLQYLQQRRSAVFFVAEQGDAIVGEGIALVRQHKKGRSGRIYSLAVRQQHRGQRIGQKLLQAMLAALAERGVSRVYLEVEKANDAALRLYSGHGFRPIGTLPDYYGPDRPGVHMMAETGRLQAVTSASSKSD
jgi:uncharacterized protein